MFLLLWMEHYAAGELTHDDIKAFLDAKYSL